MLNFNGRVTMASVKNFQLIDPDDQEAIILQVSVDRLKVESRTYQALCSDEGRSLPRTDATDYLP